MVGLKANFYPCSFPFFIFEHVDSRGVQQSLFCQYHKPHKVRLWIVWLFDLLVDRQGIKSQQTKICYHCVKTKVSSLNWNKWIGITHLAPLRLIADTVLCFSSVVVYIIWFVDEVLVQVQSVNGMLVKAQCYAAGKWLLKYYNIACSYLKSIYFTPVGNIDDFLMLLPTQSFTFLVIPLRFKILSLVTFKHRWIFVPQWWSHLWRSGISPRKTRRVLMK